MISVVIPIGHYPFFVNAVLGNIAATCGVPLSEIDLVFLTYQQISQDIQEVFEAAARTYKFRVVTAPFYHAVNHLPLLDWAMKSANLQDWVVVQHCDFFWEPSRTGWVPHLESLIEDHLFAIYIDNGDYRYLMDDVPIHALHDYFGLYNRRRFLENKLSFGWGMLGSEVRLSERASKAIEEKRLVHRSPIKRKNSAHDPLTIIPMVDWLDGSIAITLEAAAEGGVTKGFVWPFHHQWQFFKIASKIKRVGSRKEILLLTDNTYSTLAQYSWITSFYFNKDDFRDIILPWHVMQMLPNLRNWTPNRRLYRHLNQFCQETNVTGAVDVLGIERVRSSFANIDQPVSVKLL